MGSGGHRVRASPCPSTLLRLLDTCLVAAQAKAEVVACMERPFDEALPSLLVDLSVDAKVAGTWYDAK